MRLRCLTAGLLIASLAVCPLAPAMMVETVFFGRATEGVNHLTLISERPQQAQASQGNGTGVGAERTRVVRVVQVSLPARSVVGSALVPPPACPAGPMLPPLAPQGRPCDPAPSARGPPAV